MYIKGLWMLVKEMVWVDSVKMVYFYYKWRCIYILSGCFMLDIKLIFKGISIKDEKCNLCKINEKF